MDRHIARAARPAVILILLLGTLAPALVAGESFSILLPRHRIEAAEVGVIVNDDDPLSVRIGDYYRKARGIPEANLIHVRFRPGRPRLLKEEFLRIKATAEKQTPDHIQAWALTWAAPWRVDCMSITSAFAFGYDRALCSSRLCATTRPNPWFRQQTSQPFTQLGIRPTMAIAATDFGQARALIDRGVRSDGTLPGGTAWLVSTRDKARNVRAVAYPRIAQLMDGWIETRVVESEALKDVDGILFYFTGRARVPWLDTLGFLPGALADHLTSGGGHLTRGQQMSALRWLEAGATGSYGTVKEPCNLRGKFPDPARVMEVYGSGRTLLEAYWRSVRQPGEGIFIGEPLAAPFDGYRLSEDGDSLRLHTRVLLPGRYEVLYSRYSVGPYRSVGLLKADYHQQDFVLPKAGPGYYRLVQQYRAVAAGGGAAIRTDGA